MTLDMMTAQIVMRARQIERALHDPGPWTITTGPHQDQWKIPARRVIGDDHVTFYAVVPLDEGGAFTGTSVVMAELMSGDEVVAVKLLEVTGGLAQISWEFLVIAPEQVAA